MTNLTTSVPALRQAQDTKLLHMGAERTIDTVIVKLRPAHRMASVAAHAKEPEGEHVLSSLLQRGYVREIVPIFPIPVPRGEVRGPARVLAREGTEPSPRLRRAQGMMSVRVDRGTSAESLAEFLSTQDAEIEYAYVPPVRYLFALPNDPLISRQWNHGVVRIYPARSARGFVEADGVTVAVVDSGIDREHPDLDGVVHDYVNFHAATEDDRDYTGHGTHVAGIIAAEADNGIGVSGLCAARILAVKGMPRPGSPWNAERYYQALAYAIDQGARVVNLSLGGPFDRGESDIVADLLAEGITVVAAMGNDYQRGNPISYPAALEGVVAVGATDEIDRRADFSCTGDHIALVAPGVNILSTVPRYPAVFSRQLEYDSWPGTSMAAPHVSAAAALLLAKDPDLGPGDVRKRLMDSATRVPGQSDWTPEFGAGRLNIEAALA